MATLNASKTGAILMIFTALTYLYGFSAIWYFLGMIIGVFIFIPFALKLKENSSQRFYTLADYFKYNYGKKSAVIVSLITIFTMIGFLVLNLIGAAKIFVFFTAWPFWICASVMALLVLIYLLMGGFKAVVKTDVVQYVAMIIILAFLAFLFFNTSTIPVAEWGLFSADIPTFIGFFIFGLLFPFAMPDMWQRVYSSKNKKTLRNGLILAAIVYLIFALLLAVVSLTIKTNFPGVDPDLALIHGFANLLPAGLLGLAVILLFAALMSSIDTYIFTAASAVIQDFSVQDKKKTVRNVRRAIFVIAIIGTAIAIIIESLIIGTFIFVAVATVLAVSVFATWIKPSIKQKTLIYGLIIGLIGFFACLIPNLLLGNVTATIVLISLGASIIGLGIGALVSRRKK